jgi:hypothetical protein
MHYRRLTLRTWMALILAWGLVLTWARAQGSICNAVDSATRIVYLAGHVTAALGLGFFVALLFTRPFGLTVHRPGGRATVKVLLVIVLTVVVYLLWALQRWNSFIYGLDRGFPYPDPWLVALHRWFDIRHPASPGSLKLCGEFYRVLFVLYKAILAGLGVTGLLLGLLLNQRDRPRREERGR